MFIYLFIFMYLFLLGEGQFGVVYECINLDRGEVQAVKMVFHP